MMEAKLLRDLASKLEEGENRVTIAIILVKIAAALVVKEEKDHAVDHITNQQDSSTEGQS